jgi:hypothetical protein
MDTRQIRYLFKFIPDKPYLQICYRLKTHKKLNLKNPQTFNEKMQWLKLYNRKPEYTDMVDKYKVREYISKKIGEEYLIPLVGGPYYRVDEIDIDKLPNQFVLKCNHDSGSIVICNDKSKFDFEAAKKKLDYCLRHNFWYLGREWPYKNVKPCIVAEKYMVDESESELKDYKLMCFNGKVKCSFVCTNRNRDNSKLNVTFYDTEWNRMPFERHYKPSVYNIEQPVCYNKMVVLAEKLAIDIPFVRVDFYEIAGKIYFGELTYFPGSGFEKFKPNEWDKKLGDWISINKS